MILKKNQYREKFAEHKGVLGKHRKRLEVNRIDALGLLFARYLPKHRYSVEDSESLELKGLFNRL